MEPGWGCGGKKGGITEGRLAIRAAIGYKQGMSEAKPPPSKIEVARALLAKGTLFLHVDPQRGGVDVPPWLRKQVQVVLQIGLDMPVPIPDLHLDEAGVFATLSFNRSPYTCVVPWSAVFAVVGDAGQGMVWADDMPAEIAAEVEREARRRELRAVSTDSADSESSPDASSRPDPGPASDASPASDANPARDAARDATAKSGERADSDDGADWDDGDRGALSPSTLEGGTSDSPGDGDLDQGARRSSSVRVSLSERVGVPEPPSAPSHPSGPRRSSTPARPRAPARPSAPNRQSPARLRDSQVREHEPPVRGLPRPVPEGSRPEPLGERAKPADRDRAKPAGNGARPGGDGARSDASGNSKRPAGKPKRRKGQRQQLPPYLRVVK